LVVAPVTAVQSDPSGAPPDAGHLSHWNANVVGLLLQLPWVAVSVSPTVGGTATDGSSVFEGAASARA
jgi:hypothetical protein